MKLLVFYSYRLIDELDERDIIEESQCSVPCPEGLAQSEFKDYVYKNYYDKILDLEKNCCGSFVLCNLSIDYVKYLVEF